MITEKIKHIIISVIMLSAAALFTWAFISLLLIEPYPPADQLVYEECTFVKCERKTSSRSVVYRVHVKEYAEPLEIDNIVSSSASEAGLLSLKNGDKIKVSIRKTENGNDLYYMSSGQTSVLTYEDYLAEHRGNMTVGYIILPILSLGPLALLIAETVYYKKYGFCLPLGKYDL